MSHSRPGPFVTAALLLGIGLGGFVDGILLHQILQWHAMMSSVVPPLDLVAVKYNMVWDGVFHALTWATTLTGLILLFRAGTLRNVPWSKRLLAGCMIAGWGLFNLVEGLIDHQLLGIHHVRPGPHELAWDLGFLGLGGVGFIALGYAIARSYSEEAITPS